MIGQRSLTELLSKFRNEVIIMTQKLYLGLVLVLLWSLLFVPSVLAGRDDGTVSQVVNQNPPIIYSRYDVGITMKPDGNFVVREVQQIQFDGQFSTAFAEIPLGYTGGIENIQVWEDDTPYTYEPSAKRIGTYALDGAADSIYIDWRYAETKPGDVRTFVLQYEVVGGLWVYPDETILEWRAVPADRSGIPVEASRVTINLPAEVPPGQLRYTAYGPEFTVEATGNQVVFTAAEEIPDGTRFQVQVGFPPELTAAEVQPWQIAEDTAALEYRLEAMEIDLVIDRAGQVAVTEHQRVAVDAGALHSGYRSISLAYLDDIDEVDLLEGDQRFSLDQGACETYCFQVDRPTRPRTWIWYDEEERAVTVDESMAGELDIEWWFPALVKGETTTLHLQYRALGAIQVNEDSQRLNWIVVFPGRDTSVESASVRIELPPDVDWQDVTLQGGQMRIAPDGAVRVVHEGRIRPREMWQVSLTMPPGATPAQKPAWQQTLEAAEAEARQAEIRRARQQLGAALAGVLILVVGLLGVFITWHIMGRDRPVKVGAEYLSQPPSDLPPGIVAYLVDEEPTPKGVLASLFHLASLGLLRIEPAEHTLLLQRNWEEDLVRGQMLQMPSGEMVTIPDHLVTLFNALRPAIPTEKTAPLWRINTEFKKVLPTVYIEMAEEATRFFTELPAAARHRWLSIGQWLVLGGIVVAAGAWVGWVSELGWITVAPGGALAVVGLAFILISRWMPQRTRVGAEEAARWRAFRHYLRNLKRYGDLGEAQRILDDYFAYAVALDMEEVVLEQAEELGGAMPAWVYPVHLELGQDEAAPEAQPSSTPRRPLRAVQDLSIEKPTRATAGAALDSTPTRLSLQGLSSQLGRTLSDASKSVGRLLGAAVGDSQGDTPFKLVLKGTGRAAELTWDVTSSTLEVIGDILEESSSGGGSGGHRGWSSSSSSSTRWSSSSSRSSRSSSFGGRSSSSRRSGGGGRRGFG